MFSSILSVSSLKDLLFSTLNEKFPYICKSRESIIIPMYPSVSNEGFLNAFFKEDILKSCTKDNRVDGIKVKYENISEADFDVFIG